MSRHTERITATDYGHGVKVPSKLITGLWVSQRDRFHCPRCEEDIGQLDHGETAHCECGLYTTLWGNSLEISEDPPDPEDLTHA